MSDQLFPDEIIDQAKLPPWQEKLIRRLARLGPDAKIIILMPRGHYRSYGR